MKILIFLAVALLFAVIVVLPVEPYVVLAVLFSPIILAVILIDLNRSPHAEKA